MLWGTQTHCMRILMTRNTMEIAMENLIELMQWSHFKSDIGKSNLEIPICAVHAPFTSHHAAKLHVQDRCLGLIHWSCTGQHHVDYLSILSERSQYMYLSIWRCVQSFGDIPWAVPNLGVPRDRYQPPVASLVLLHFRLFLLKRDPAEDSAVRLCTDTKLPV